MKNLFLTCILYICSLSLFGQITANGNSGTSTTAYTDGSPNESIYIWSANTLATNNGSLTATPPSGTGPWTFQWYYHDQTTFSWVAYSSSTGATSTISGLASDGYRVQITDNLGTLVGCYNAWVWNLNGQISITQGAQTCSSTNLTGNVASNGTFTYYNPPEATSLVNSSTTVTVSFSGTHTWVSDLGFFLIGPTACGSPIVTMAPRRNSPSVCNMGNDINNLVFTTASTSVFDICSGPSYTTPLTGTYGKYRSDAATNVTIDWSPIYGCNAASGGWKVQIWDCTSLDVGALTNASVTFSGLTSFCGSPTTMSYNSGVINSAINDNSCSALLASSFNIPPSTAYTTPIVANASTTYLWTASPAITFPSSTTASLTQNITGLAAASSTTFTLTETITYGAFSTTYNATNTFTAPSSPTATAGGTQTICANGTATVSGATSSNGTIAWTENGAGSITSGETTLTPVYTAAAGDAGNTVTLTMTVTSNASCAPLPSAANANYSVSVSTTTSISSQLTAAQTVCQSSPFTAISVTATGVGLSYQWYSNTSASNSGGTLIVGATSASYTPSSASAGTLYYYCVVSGTCGNATSAVSGAFLTRATTTISSQSTAGQTVCIGSPYTAISVTATGVSLTYQWYSNTSASNSGGTLIVGATSSSYTPSSASSGTIYYYCIVSGTCGSATSAVSGAFLVNPTTAISSQSTAAQTVCEGSPFTVISVTSVGVGLTYQWYSNISASNSGGTLIVGATSASYTPSSASAGTLYYYCVVSGTCGNATSAVSGAFLTRATTTISSQSTAAQTVCIGSPYTAISVTATGVSLTYQWYSNTSSSNSGGTLIVGATSSSYTPSSASSGTLYYYCIVSGTCGSATSSVSGAFLVNPTTAISSQSTVAQTACVGSPFTAISVTTAGVGLTYQWYSNTASSNSGGTLIVGATSSIYTPSSATAGTLYYYCVVSGTCGNATSAVSGAMIVNPGLTPISSQSTVGQIICFGSSFTSISVTAVGTNISYQWYSNTSASNSGGTLIVGATSASYTPSSAAVGISFYYCVVTTDCGSQSSTVSGAFMVNSPTAPITTQSTSGQAICFGSTFTPISVTVQGTNITYQWYSNTTASNSGGTLIVGATSASYTPSSAVVGVTYYYCMVTTDCGNQTSAVSGVFMVNSPTAPITTQSTAGQAICVGSTFTPISLTVQGTNITYQWYSNTTASNSGGTLIVGATSAIYTPSSAVVGVTYYYCMVTTECGNQTSAVSGVFMVNSPTAPITTQSTAGQAICVGSTFTPISVTVQGTNITYQWYSNTTASNSGGTLIVGATSSSYTPSSAVVGVTYYYCMVTTDCGNQTSAVSGAFMVNSPTAPIISQSMGSQTICEGSTFTPISVTVQGTNITYQWYSNTTASNSGGTLIVGATSASYTPSSAVVGVTYYYCMVTTDCGSQTSNISSAFVVNPTIDPISVENISGQAICYGNTFLPISVTVIGTNITYEWYSNTIASNSGGISLGASGQSASYTPSSAFAGTLYYYCMVTTACSVISSNVSGAFVVNPLPTATITATQLVVCKNSTQPQVTFTGATGTSPYTFTYNVNGGATQTITTTSGNSVNVNVPTTIVGSFMYNLIDVTDASSTTCSNAQTGSVSITVNALPTASISGSTSICEGGTTPITFTGTPNSIVSYSFNNGVTQTITLDGSGNGTLTTSALSNDGTYSLISVATTATPSCSQTQSGSANVVVVSYPVNPTVSSDVTYCIGEPIADMTASSNSGGVLIWYADANLTDSLGVGTNFTPEAKTATFYITEMTPYPYCESSPSAISILVQDCEITFPTAFTPDGDNVNDKWVIENLDAVYPKSIVRIYNRWGNIVFESKEGVYEQDPWDGKLNLEDLPVASYYFSIEYNDGKHDPKKGTVTIIRK